VKCWAHGIEQLLPKVASEDSVTIGWYWFSGAMQFHNVLHEYFSNLIAGLIGFEFVKMSIFSQLV